MKEKTGSSAYKRKWARAMRQKLLLAGRRGKEEEGKKQPARRDVRMYDVSLLRKLDFSPLHARTTTGANRKQQKTVLSTDPGTPVMRD